MFWVAGELFGFTFTPVDGRARSYHPDVRVWEVTDRERQARRPLVLRSLRARRQAVGRLDERVPQPGALRRRGDDDRLQQLELREGQARRAGARSAGTTRTTLFHEFGHALHGLSSNVDYPTLAGTRRARDYVEFPSQLLEHWLLDARGPQQVRSCTTRRASRFPTELVAKIEKAATFNQGFDDRRVPGLARSST